MTDHPYCPACGYNLRKEMPITQGDWHLTSDLTLHRGARVPITRQQSYVLYTIAQAKGRWVRLETVGNRVTHKLQSEDPRNLAAAQLCKARKGAARVGLTLPLESRRGYSGGVRWSEK